jgi:hypothetical protein
VADILPSAVGQELAHRGLLTRRHDAGTGLSGSRRHRDRPQQERQQGDPGGDLIPH